MGTFIFYSFGLHLIYYTQIGLPGVAISITTLESLKYFLDNLNHYGLCQDIAHV